MLYNRKICPKWGRREPRRSTIIILQEVGLKTGSDIPLSSDLCQWMRAKKFEQVSYHIKAFGILYYVQPETCFNDLYWILEFHKRFSLKKSWLLKVFVNYTCDTLTRPKAIMSFKCTGSKWPCPWMPSNYISRKGRIYPRSLRFMNEHYRETLRLFKLTSYWRLLVKAKLSKRTN